MQRAIQFRLNQLHMIQITCSFCRKMYVESCIKIYDVEDRVVDYVVNDLSGKTYSIRAVCAKHWCCEGKLLKFRPVESVYNEEIACGRHCYEDKGRHCECNCGGTLHSVSLQRVLGTLKEW